MILSRPTIGIVDPCCPAPYGPDIADPRTLGGTEATVLRIVAALGNDVRFRLFQPHRMPASSGLGAPLDQAFEHSRCDGFVVINSWKVACRLRRFHPHIPISVWLHVHPGRHNRRMGAALAAAEIDIICVSKSHARQVRDFLQPGPLPCIGHVWNPIPDGLEPDATPRDPWRLLFASSPHKGLAEVLERFRAVREEMPDLVLEVADPGYMRWDVGPIPEGVWLRGRLSQDRLVDRMRRALCLFYPQTTFAETFGLVIAEANAVGTPVLAQNGLGANDEVVCGPGQLVDCAKPEILCERIRAWQDRPPPIRTHPEFRLSNVAALWRTRLAAMVDRKPIEPAEQKETERKEYSIV